MKDPALLLWLKIVLVSAVVSLSWFIGDYSHLSRDTETRGWWHDPVGRTVVLLDVLVVMTLMPSLLAVFLHFSRFTSMTAAWLQVGLLGLITPLMLHRSWLFRRLRRQARADQVKHAAGNE